MSKLNNNNYKDYASSLEKFFTKYLAIEKRVSKYTIRSYRDTFILLLDYMKNRRNKCFMIYEDPVHIAQWKMICSIKQQKQIKETVRYLTIEVGCKKC